MALSIFLCIDATIPSQQPHFIIGGPRLPPHLVQATLEQPKLSQQGNPVDIKRQFLYALYTSILPKRVVLVLQLNALTVNEYQRLNREFKKKGMNILKIRLGIFRAAVKDFAKRKGKMSWVDDIMDPRPTDTRPLYGIDSIQDGWKLSEMPAGHTAIVCSDISPDTTYSTILAQVNEVIQKVKLKVLMVGGKIDNSVYSREELDYAATLPPLKELREELVGLLQSPAAKVAGHLEMMEKMTGGSLVKVLDARGKDVVSLLSRHSSSNSSGNNNNSSSSHSGNAVDESGDTI